MATIVEETFSGSYTITGHVGGDVTGFDNSAMVWGVESGWNPEPGFLPVINAEFPCPHGAVNSFRVRNDMGSVTQTGLTLTEVYYRWYMRTGDADSYHCEYNNGSITVNWVKLVRLDELNTGAGYHIVDLIGDTGSGAYVAAFAPGIPAGQGGDTPWAGEYVKHFGGFTACKWYYCEWHVKLNTPGVADGMIEFRKRNVTDGGTLESFSWSNLNLRGSSSATLHYVRIGGNRGGDGWWNVPTDGYVRYANVKVATTGWIGEATETPTVDFPSHAVLDYFNRTDADPLNGNWIDATFGHAEGWKLASDVIASDAAAGDFGASAWTYPASSADGEVFCSFPTIMSATANRRFYLCWGAASPSAALTCYALRIKYTAAYYWALVRFNSGVETELIADTAIASHANGDKFGFRVTGNILQCYRDSGTGWATLGSEYDDSGSGSKIATAGYVGVMANDTTLRVDDVGAGPMTAQTATTGAEAAAGDDWTNYYNAGWQWSTGGGFLGMGYYTPYRLWVGMRLTLADAIPDGAVIDTDVAKTYLRLIQGDQDNCDSIYYHVTDAADAGQVTDAAGRPAFDGGSTTVYPASAEHASAIHYASTPPPIGNIVDIPVGPLIQYLVDTYGGLAAGAHIVFWGYGATTEDGFETAYAFYEQATYATPTLYVSYSAGTASLLAIQAITHAPTLDSLVITEDHQLVIAECVAQQTIDTITFAAAPPAAAGGLVVSPLYGIY